MRILHTVAYYAPDQGGGAQEVVRQVSEGLVRLGHHVTIATTFSSARQIFKLNGVEIKQFAIHGLLNQSVLGIYGDVSGYFDYIQNSDFDIIMNYAAQTWHADLTFRVLSKLSAKTVLVPCGYSGLIFPRILVYWSYYQRLPKILRSYDAIIYHSANYRDREFGDSHGVTNYKIIPNGVQLNEFIFTEIDFRKTYSIHTHYLVLCVGDHYANKGHRRVIEALARLKRNDVTLVIIGRNLAAWYRSCWTECCKAERESAGKILLLDNAPRSHVIAAYQAADLFVSGSRVEVFPLVIVESMAAGVPFVAFSAGNIEELGGGVVVQSVQEMANRINSLLDDEAEKKRLGHLGQTEQRAKYNWPSIVKEYETLYRKLLDYPERSQ